MGEAVEQWAKIMEEEQVVAEEELEPLELLAQETLEDQVVGHFLLQPPLLKID